MLRTICWGQSFFQQQDLKGRRNNFAKPCGELLGGQSLLASRLPDEHGSYQDALSEIETATRLDPDRQLYRARREELLKLMNTNSR